MCQETRKLAVVVVVSHNLWLSGRAFEHLFTVNCCWKDENKEKREAGNGPFYKKKKLKLTTAVEEFHFLIASLIRGTATTLESVKSVGTRINSIASCGLIQKLILKRVHFGGWTIPIESNKSAILYGIGHIFIVVNGQNLIFVNKPSGHTDAVMRKSVLTYCWLCSTLRFHFDRKSKLGKWFWNDFLWPHRERIYSSFPNDCPNRSDTALDQAFILCLTLIIVIFKKI